MGWGFGWDAHGWTARVDEAERRRAIRSTIADTPGVKAVHGHPHRKMGDMIAADAYIEVDAQLPWRPTPPCDAAAPRAEPDDPRGPVEGPDLNGPVAADRRSRSVGASAFVADPYWRWA